MIRTTVGRLSRWWFLLGLTPIVPLGCHQPQRAQPTAARTAVRAIWVTRWDFKTPADIETIMSRCQRSGYNTVLFQVRGNGTVLYPSRIEPWSKEFDGKNPGFDPLKKACAEAHRRGLKLHAWVNVMPGWRGDAQPLDRRQLYHAHPDWFWHDAQGRRQPLGWYNSLNPCLPVVRKYLTNIMHEIVSRYPVDGLHLDYMRFPNEWHKMYAGIGHIPDYPRDGRTLSLFASENSGATPESSPQRWDAWRTEQVTKLLRDIRRMMSTTRPGLPLSVAVGAFPDESKRRHFQDSKLWMEQGLLDAVYPMNYSQDMTTFNKALHEWGALRSTTPVVMGIMFDKRDPRLVSHQVSLALQSQQGYSAFAYSSLFPRSPMH